ncbi:MAG: hypothetical protein M3068_14940 [Gemmatimonadota bacterium]|nr:hypothetical protein [Gemmatimonadota bacterium]
MTYPFRSTVRSLAALAVVLAACSEDRNPTAPRPAANQAINGHEAPAPAGLVTLALGSHSLSVWPFTGVDFSGTPSDPINLVFTGKADPRQIRAALMGLSGTGRPGPLAAFGCTWDDAVGDPQTNYGADLGWVGSAIQLECGDYYGPRFHLRMFRQGGVTVANAHYEILIPGTNEHEVLSWELAEQLVTADMARTGFLGAAPGATDVITPTPYYRAVQAPVAKMLSPQQIGGLGLRVNADGTASIPNDGRATILQLGSAPQITDGMAERDFIISFGQVIPKPFCTAGTTGYLYASGPIRVRMHSGISGKNYFSGWTAEGTLTLIEFNPLTGQPAGVPYQGVVNEKVTTDMTQGNAGAEHISDRREIPDDGPTRGSRIEYLRVRENGHDVYTLKVTC